jgi:hypothetical protein
VGTNPVSKRHRSHRQLYKKLRGEKREALNNSSHRSRRGPSQESRRSAGSLGTRTKEGNSDVTTENERERRGGGEAARRVHMRSPATAYAEWAETGWARQGRRRRRAMNLKSPGKRRETLVGEATADRRWLKLQCRWLPSERLEGVVADEVKLRRASHGCQPAAVYRRTPSAGWPCRLCGCGFNTADWTETARPAPERSGLFVLRVGLLLR